MKFTITQTCRCGGRYVFSTYGDGGFRSAVCSSCGIPGDLLDPLSVSVIAERLLYRGKAELESGDYSLSIIIDAIAIETFLSRLFFKLKRMDNYVSTFSLPTAMEEAEWEKEYPRSGGFLSPANWVSNKLIGVKFNEFIASNPTASSIFSQLPNPSGFAPAQYFQNEIFARRNRIVHWGYVNSDKAEAERCHEIAVSLVSILREMDKIKYGSL